MGEKSAGRRPRPPWAGLEEAVDAAFSALNDDHPHGGSILAFLDKLESSIRTEFNSAGVDPEKLSQELFDDKGNLKAGLELDLPGYAAVILHQIPAIRTALQDRAIDDVGISSLLLGAYCQLLKVGYLGQEINKIEETVRAYGVLQDDTEAAVHRLTSGGALLINFHKQALPFLRRGRAFAEGPKRPRTHALSTAIDRALQRLGPTASADAVLEEIKNASELVQEIDQGKTIYWTNGTAEKQTSFRSFQNLITARRKKLSP